MLKAIFVVLYLIALCLMVFSMITMLRRRKRMMTHLIASRKLQMESLEALQEGDRPRSELLLAAAREALDRAEYFS